VSYVGEGEKARTVKICVNLLLALVSQGMGEVTVLAQRAGVPRAAFLDFLNGSVVGSTFTRYKTPQLVGLDFTPTFTTHLHRKDVELGLALGGSLSTPTPLVAQAHQTLLAAIAEGLGDLDFASVLRLQARAAGLELEPEVAGGGDGLEPLDDIARAELADS
jgi:3-hydroxyisobutyrate dehydrogenase-like beta-hydroxyacid dehydrogenase